MEECIDYYFSLDERFPFVLYMLSMGSRKIEYYLYTMLKWCRFIWHDSSLKIDALSEFGMLMLFVINEKWNGVWCVCKRLENHLCIFITYTNRCI